MLTDNDKVDLFLLIMDMGAKADGNFNRNKLVTYGMYMMVRFIVKHPDICAAEIDDFLSDNSTEQEIRRWLKKGML